jgi:hypothetical protein
MKQIFIIALITNALCQNAAAQGHEQAVEQTVSTAVQLLNGFWRKTFKKAGLSYLPPTQVSAYAKPRQTACGATLPNNAFYCPADRSIWYDRNFLGLIQRQRGRFAVYTIIAHEWGHFISYELRQNHRRSIAWELQADCLAGAFAGWFADQMPGDFAEYIQGAQTLLSMGDRDATPWFAPGAHGQPEARVRAFFKGFYRGNEACFQN